MLSEEEKYEMSLVAKLYQKKGQARLKINEEDTSPDKAMPGARGGVTKYLSIDRMKAILNKVLPMVGLDYRVNQIEPEYEMRKIWESQEWKDAHHYSQHLIIDLIDTETGYFVRDDAYGEATNNRDKAMNYSESYALKNWMSATFGFADNLKEEDECIITQEEADKRRSKMPPGMPVKSIVKKEIDTSKDAFFRQKDESKIQQKAHDMKAEAEDKTVEKTEVKEEIAVPTTPVLEKPKELSAIQKRAFDNAVKEIKSNEERFSVDELRTLNEAIANVKDDASYKSFLNIKTMAFKRLKEAQ